MQPDLKHIDDLDYLANAGFEKVSISDSDLKDLNKRVKNRSASAGNGFYFGVVNLLIGVFIGVSVFFTFYNAPKIYPAPKDKAEPVQVAEVVKEKLSVTNLDTIKVVAENFVNPIRRNETEVKAEVVARNLDTAAVLKPIEASSLAMSPDKLSEAQIKYIPNAPIIFLHDLKITNYSTLYFRQNRFVTLTVKSGLDAAYANKEDREKDNFMYSKPSYYLHQAISDAMLYFNKKDISKCLSTLNMITDINPGDINCQFYSGMCYYYKKDYASAIKKMDFCIGASNNTFLNEAQYYKAMCLYEQGNKQEAFVLFKQIADEGGFYAAKAKQFLN